MIDELSKISDEELFRIMIKIKYLYMSNLETRLREIENELHELYCEFNEDWERSDYKDHISVYQRNLMKMASMSVDIARQAVVSASNMAEELMDNPNADME